MNILQKKEIIDFCDSSKLSARKVAQIFGAKFDRPLHHSSIRYILRQRTEILSMAAQQSENFFDYMKPPQERLEPYGPNT